MIKPSEIVPTMLSRRDMLYAFAWLIAVCGCALFCGWQVAYNKPFHSNLLELLPKDERNPALHDLSQLMASRFEDKLMVLIKVDTPEQTLPLAKDLQERLAASKKLSVDGGATQAIQQELIKLYRPFSQQLLSPERRAWLQSHSPDELAMQTYQDLFSPLALPRPFGFAEDPFNLGASWLTSLLPALNVQEYEGFPVITEGKTENTEGKTGHAAGQRWLMIIAKLNASPFDLSLQQDVSAAIVGFHQRWPQATILTSGMVFHATAGTQQATSEMSTVGVGSTLCIVLLVIGVFRRITPLIAVLISMTSAYLLALTVSLLVFGSIHVITLAFGSTLLGVAGDYAIHFLVASHSAGSGLAARRHLRHAMAIGALTGMAAYLLQFTTPFPGLQQMAIFCAAGIFGAWMTVLALAPFYRLTPKSINAPLVAAEKFYRVAQRIYPACWSRPRLVAVFLLLVVAASLVSVLRGGTNDAVINLNTSPMSLLQSEREVQQILQQPSVSRFFFIDAESPEQLLVRSQKLGERLTALALPNLRWQSLDKYAPSEAQQVADRQLVQQKLYGEQGALKILCEKLGSPCTSPSGAQRALSIDALNATSLGGLLPPMMNQNGRWVTLVTISGDAPSAQVSEAVIGLDGVKLVNQTEDLSQLLGRYRASVSGVLGLTLLLLALGLSWRYRSQGWRMLVPLVVAMMLALAVAAVDGITLFHVMALLLIIGIGLDTAVFYTEGGFNDESWLASSLSCGTSIIAFGLLSLSAVPVLHQFGSIILVGILSCWLLTPLFFAPRPAQGNTCNTQ